MDPGVQYRVVGFVKIVLEALVECTAERSNQV